MDKEEIQKLLNFILDNNKLSDQDIIALIYDLIERIESTCYGDKDYFSKERFDRIYKELFYGIFADFIASYDYLDKMINDSLFVRDKEIVDKEKHNENK